MLCIYTIIPSLFPFLVLSALVNSSFSGFGGKFFRPFRKLCGMPQGSEQLFLLGFLGGYPVGAQSIYQAFKSGQLTEESAKRLLSFCSNAGPAFIFGMIGCLFSSPLIPWILWAIHIASAILVAILVPGKSVSRCTFSQGKRITVSQAAEQGVKITAVICGWVILFRIIFSICDRWFLWLLPGEAKIIICGLLELSNGCSELMAIESDGIKFIISACFLSFGGLCVIMQTSAVTKELGIKQYITGKILQCSISLLLSAIIQWFLFPPRNKVAIPYPLVFISTAIICLQIFLNYRKNSSRNLVAVDV